MALPAKPPPLGADQRQGHRRRGNEPRFEARQRLYAVAGVDLTAIEGIDAGSALVILSEIGTDMSRWATEKKFGAWLGLAPRPKKSGGRLLSSRTRPGCNRAAQALRLSALVDPFPEHLGASSSDSIAAWHAQGDHGDSVQAGADRVGMLKHGTSYTRQEMEVYEEKYRERQVKPLRRKAKERGYELREAAPRAAAEPTQG